MRKQKKPSSRWIFGEIHSHLNDENRNRKGEHKTNVNRVSGVEKEWTNERKTGQGGLAFGEYLFSRDVLKGGVWKSKKALVDQILLYIRKYNEERAKPFRWTYTGKPLTL